MKFPLSECLARVAEIYFVREWLWLGGVFLLYPHEVVGVIASLLCLTKEVVDDGLVELGSAGENPRKRLRLKGFTGVLSIVYWVVHEMKLAKIETRSVTKSITNTVSQYFRLVSW